MPEQTAGHMFEPAGTRRRGRHSIGLPGRRQKSASTQHFSRPEPDRARAGARFRRAQGWFNGDLLLYSRLAVRVLSRCRSAAGQFPPISIHHLRAAEAHEQTFRSRVDFSDPGGSLGAPGDHGTQAQGCGFNAIVCENLQAGRAGQRVGRAGRRRHHHPGLHDGHQRQPGRRRSSSRSRPTATSYRLDIYRMGYYDGMGARKVATVSPSAALPQTQPACLTHAGDRVDRLRQLGGVGVVGRARDGDVRDLLRQGAFAPTPAAPATSSSSSATTAAVRPAVPDVRHDVAGLQHLRRQQPLRRGAGRARLQGELQPADHRPARSIGGQQERRSFNAEYPMVRWLEANGYNVSYTQRRRHGSPRRRAPRAQGVSVGRPRRILVGAAAHQRRERHATPASTSRSSAATRCSGRRAGRTSIDGAATPYRTLGLLQGNARQRQDRSDRGLDRHVARSRASRRPPMAAGRRTR